MDRTSIFPLSCRMTNTIPSEMFGASLLRSEVDQSSSSRSRRRRNEGRNEHRSYHGASRFARDPRYRCLSVPRNTTLAQTKKEGEQMKNLDQIKKELTKIDEKLSKCGNTERCNNLKTNREALLRLKADLERTIGGDDKLEQQS